MIVAPVLWACTLAPCLGQGAYQQEGDRLGILLNWKSGSVVAEIGAGSGQITLAAAARVGASGRVYSTELDAKKLAQLQKIAEEHKNITAVKGAEAETNLPSDCCDSIWMRLVYHHLVKPRELDAGLFRSLKPGGQLALIDEEPGPGSSRVEGVPENRVPLRSWAMESGRVEVHADHLIESFQGTPFPWWGDSLRPLVPPVSSGVRTCL
jgi:SAM-dependent methyltransferase